MIVSKLSTELLDNLLSDYKKPEDLIGENGLLKQLTKALVERALEAEMEHHLGHSQHDAVTNSTGNARNGRSSKTLKGEFGERPFFIIKIYGFPACSRCHVPISLRASAHWVGNILSSMISLLACAEVFPFKIATFNHMYAETLSRMVPCPFIYITPRLYCAGA